MGDLISRQAAIEAVNELTKWYWETYHEKRPTTVGVIDKLMELPSAQQWHTEPPKESGFYIVCTDLGMVGEGMYTRDGEWYTDVRCRFLSNIVAWMPLPKPYRKGANPP